VIVIICNMTVWQLLVELYHRCISKNTNVMSCNFCATAKLQVFLIATCIWFFVTSQI